MKITATLIFGMNIVAASPLYADPPAAAGHGHAQESAQLEKSEEHLETMKAGRLLDTEQARQANVEFRKGKAAMSNRAEQQRQDVRGLESVEIEVKTGKKEKALARQSYKDTVQKYGTDDPRAQAAEVNWKESQQATDLLLEGRKSLKKDIHQGNRQVHNAKTVLDVQQRSLDSNARYRAIDDRKIERAEKNVADDKRAIIDNVQAAEVLAQTTLCKRLDYTSMGTFHYAKDSAFC